MSCYPTAVDYLRRGWASLSLCPPDHVGVGHVHTRVCRDLKSRGKVPLGIGGDCRWKCWQERLPTDAEIESQWKFLPTANVGIVLGAVSGLVGIDVDSSCALEELRRQKKILRTACFRTKRGLRFLYRMNNASLARSSVVPLPSGASYELLADGRITVMPPSQHVSGYVYDWVSRREPARLPDYFLQHVEVPKAGTPAAGIIPEGNRALRLTQIAGSLRRFGCGTDEIRGCLSVVNAARCRPLLGEDEIARIARSIARYPIPI